jgi:hypothetical protein
MAGKMEIVVGPSLSTSQDPTDRAVTRRFRIAGTKTPHLGFLSVVALNDSHDLKKIDAKDKTFVVITPPIKRVSLMLSTRNKP